MRPVWRTETTRNRPLTLSPRSHSLPQGNTVVVRLVGSKSHCSYLRASGSRENFTTTRSRHSSEVMQLVIYISHPGYWVLTLFKLPWSISCPGFLTWSQIDQHVNIPDCVPHTTIKSPILLLTGWTLPLRTVSEKKYISLFLLFVCLKLFYNRKK